MSLDDLNLEFEDEDEAKKKKSDAVQVDVDLEFHADSPKAAAPRPQAPQVARPVLVGGNAQAQAKVQTQTSVARPQAAKPMMTQGSAALKVAPESNQVIEGNVELESEEIIRLREESRKAQFDAEVKVQVAEFKTDLLVELMSDVKLMDHQVNQLLARIHAKHPDMKQEVLMIKKLLADFTAKKRK